MSFALNWRRLAQAAFTGAALATFAVAAPIAVGGIAPAHAQIAGEFQAALQPYGAWRRHARWGLVWVPAGRPQGWRPYTHGHWVYTEAWGWYWLSDRDEEDWGWVAYHYGRWVFERGIGWLWVSGDEWAPAWVNWRRGGDFIGWAPLPPDAVIDDADAEPVYWIFVQPRNLIAPGLRGFVLPPARNAGLLRSTVLVNRTVMPEHGRAAINAGIAPAIVGAAARAAIQAYRVAPRVVAGTQGVSGAIAVRPQDLSRRVTPGISRFGVSAQRTATAIQPAASVPKPEPLGRGARGHLGAQAPQVDKAPQAERAPPQQTPPPARPAAEPALKPPPPPIVAPSAAGPGGPPPQAKPQRPIVPQTPPPPPPKAGPRMAPPAIARPAPPPRPMQPVIRPTPPPAPSVARPTVAGPAAVKKPAAVKPPPRKKPKPGEKPDEKN